MQLCTKGKWQASKKCATTCACISFPPLPPTISFTLGTSGLDGASTATLKGLSMPERSIAALPANARAQARARRAAWRGRCSSCCRRRWTPTACAACMSAGRLGCNMRLLCQDAGQLGCDMRLLCRDALELFLICLWCGGGYHDKRAGPRGGPAVNSSQISWNTAPHLFSACAVQTWSRRSGKGTCAVP